MLTLSQCLHEALTRPDLLRQQAALNDQARQGVKIARSQFLTLRSIIQVQTTSDNQVSSVTSDGTIASREEGRIGLGISVPVYDGGRRRIELGIAKNNVQGTLESNQAARIAVMEDTTDAFYAVLSGQRRQEVGRLQLQAAQDLLAAAQSRYAVGAVTLGDVLTAQSIVGQAETDQRGRVLDLDTARVRLTLLLGRDPLSVAPIAIESSAQPALPDSVEQLLARLMSSSPERARIVIDLDNSVQNIRAVRAERAPQVTLSGSGGYLIDSHSRPYATVDLELNLPLLDRPVLDAREQEARDTQALRAIDLRNFDADARARILTAFLSYRAALESIAPSQAAVAAEMEANRLATGRYQAGKGIQQEVLQSQVVLTQARDRLAAAEDNRDAAAEGLARLIGAAAPETSVGPMTQAR